MSKYAILTDGNDLGLVLTQSDLDAADVFVDSQISLIGVDPEEITPNDLLKNIAIHYSYYCVATRSASGEDNLLLDKADRYRRLYQDEIATLSKRTLGLDKLPSRGFRAIPIYRS